MCSCALLFEGLQHEMKGNRRKRKVKELLRTIFFKGAFVARDSYPFRLRLFCDGIGMSERLFQREFLSYAKNNMKVIPDAHSP